MSKSALIRKRLLFKPKRDIQEEPGSRQKAKPAFSPFCHFPVIRDSFARVSRRSSLRGTLIGDPVSNGIVVAHGSRHFLEYHERWRCILCRKGEKRQIGLRNGRNGILHCTWHTYIYDEACVFDTRCMGRVHSAEAAATSLTPTRHTPSELHVDWHALSNFS